MSGPNKVFANMPKRSMEVVFTSSSRTEAETFAAERKAVGGTAVVKSLKTGPRTKTRVVFNVWSFESR